MRRRSTASALANQLRKSCESVWNMYGPTETTIWSTLHRVNDSGDKVPIGRPIAETQVYVLDAGLRPVASGEEGELYIGGAGLARGYRNRPELTADASSPTRSEANQALDFIEPATVLGSSRMARWSVWVEWTIR